jgi:hypothetical protein
MRKSFTFVMLAYGALWSSLNGANGSTPGQDFKGSCNFQGQFAGGCIEFLDGTWDSDSMFQYCQSKNREGIPASVLSEPCPRNDYNSLCATNVQEKWANMYVNNMPAYICKKYNSGELSKRPASGW